MERQGFVSFIDDDEDEEFQPKGVFKIFEHRTAAVEPSQFSEKILQELTRADVEEKAALQAQKEAVFLEALRISQIEGEEDPDRKNYLPIDPSSALDISISPRFDQLLAEVKPEENKNKSINNINLNNVPNLRSTEEDHTEHVHGRFKSEIEKWLFDLENLDSELKPVIEEEREWIEKTEQRQMKLEEYSREAQFDLNERLKANREQAEKDFTDLQASKEKILARQERQRKKTIKQLSKDTSKLQKENELTSRKLQKTFAKLRNKIQTQKGDNLFLSLSHSVGDFDFGSGATSLVTSTYASSSSEDEYFSASEDEHEEEQ